MARAVSGPGQPVPLVDFIAEADVCPTCGGGVKVAKSRVRRVVTVTEGAFDAREVLKQCWCQPPCPMVGSGALARLVPPRQRNGYDLIVHVGLARYLRHQQREEICNKLAEEHGITLSTGTVSNLCDRFLVYLEALHLCRVPNLGAAMDGGYPLHVDVTCDKGKGGVAVCMDGWRGWVLVAGRVPTENADDIRPLVEMTTDLFGLPVSTMRDLSDRIGGAMASVHDRDVPDLLCHYHFLGAVGKALFDSAYDRLRRMLRGHAVQKNLRALLRDLRRYDGSAEGDGLFGPGRVREELKALVLWVLDGDSKKTPAYPFALCHLQFARRSQDAPRRLDDWVPTPWRSPEHRAIRHLRSLLARLDRDPRIAATVRELDERWQVSTEFRDVLRLTEAELPGGDTPSLQLPLPASEWLRLQRIERDFDRFTTEMEERAQGCNGRGGTATPEGIVLRYLTRYRGKLFGHPARRNADGEIIAVVPRTNNPAEHLFGRGKQGLRRRLGRANLGRDLQQQPAQVMLTQNLSDPAYVRVVCGSMEHLPAAFASLDPASLDEAVLVRDHRDSALVRRVRALLEGDKAGLSASISTSGVTPATVV